MSAVSSCASSPFSSPESCTELDLLDMPMFFPGDNSVYQQLLDVDASSVTGAVNQSEQRQQPQQHKPQYHQQPLFDYQMAQVGVFTPPTSPSAPAFQKYNSGLDGPDLGTLFYGVQPLTIQQSNNAYVQYSPLSVQSLQSVSVVSAPAPQPTTLSLMQQQQQQRLVQQQQQYQQQQAYQMLLSQFDNLENSVAFSPSLSSSCSSSLSGSPNFSESPLMAAVSSDFDLFPSSRPAPQQQQKMMNTATTGGFPSAPVMAPSGNAGGGGYHHNQMTPPMNQMDLEREAASSLFRNEYSHQQHQHQAASNDQMMTTELSLLCKCPGQFPCGDQMPDAPVELSPSSLEDIAEDEVSESESASEDDEEDEEDEEEDRDPSYNVGRTAGGASRNSFKANRPKSMTISTGHSHGPYDSAYSRSPSVSSSVSPVRQDRRRSSSGSFGSGSGSSLLEPEQVPEIKDIHVCPVCQRRFTRPFNLRSHLMTHTTARPFPCDECHWKFTRQHDLQRHRKAKHPQSYNASNPKKDAAAAQAV
ncbi:hypothetical protein BGZ83_007537 [Gryganskiella cystojenkinii]|nr:hypothetical protein BGZ83_007537 [Gryganskiella cystojenkinii]